VKSLLRVAVLSICAASILLCGCPRACPESLVSLDQLVAEYNANAAGVPRLWARAKIAVTLTNEKGQTIRWGSVSPLARPNGLLLLGKGTDRLGPHDLVLIGRQTAAAELFRLGSSAAEGVYYLWYRFGEHAAAMWGRHDLAGAPGATPLPIDPNQLLAVLSICALPDDFTRPPMVALSMAADPCAYVVTYLDRQPISGRILFRREVYFHWDQTKPRRAFLINFFAEDGRRVMTARMKKYKPIGGAGPEARAPVMPTDIEITWPQKKSSMHIVLSEMTAEEKWDRAACGFRDHLPAGIDPGDILQVDKHLQTGGTSR